MINNGRENGRKWESEKNIRPTSVYGPSYANNYISVITRAKSVYAPSISAACIEKYIDNCNKLCTISRRCRVHGRYAQLRIKKTTPWVMDHGVFDNLVSEWVRVVHIATHRLNGKVSCRGCCFSSSSSVCHFQCEHTSVNKKVNHFLAEWIAINMCSMLTCNIVLITTHTPIHSLWLVSCIRERVHIFHVTIAQVFHKIKVIARSRLELIKCVILS